MSLFQSLHEFYLNRSLTFIGNETLEMVTSGLLSHVKSSHDPLELPVCFFFTDI